MRLITRLFQQNKHDRKNTAAQPREESPDSNIREIESLITQGHTKEDLGELDEAERYYKKALELDPQYSRSFMNLGNVLEAKGNLEESEANYRLAISHAPKSGGAYANLGSLYLKIKRYEDALELFLKAIELIESPQKAEALIGAGFALNQLNRHNEAIPYYQKSLILLPDHEGANLALAQLLILTHKKDEATTRLIRFLGKNPENVEAHGMLAKAYIDLGMHTEGMKHLDASRQLDPDNDYLSGMRLFMLNFLPDLPASKLFDEHKAHARHFFSRLYPDNPAFDNNKNIDRRLKVGYVSADFKKHPVAVFIEPVFKHYNRSRFEVHAWHSTTVHDDITESFRKMVDVWHEIAEMDDAAVAKSIKDARIDILIDLSGHTGGHRLPVFARKPAPIQATWLGYIGTTALKTMDYRICDNFSDPPGMTEIYHTEALARLPHSQWCHIPYTNLPAITETPAATRQHLTLGSFNNATKLNDEVLLLWSSILQQIPDAQLHLAAIPEGRAQARIINFMAHHQIPGSRLSFIPRLDYTNYLAAIGNVDIALDPFPYNGGTTSLDILMVGVPFVTLAGNHSIARGGVSLLSNAGLTDFIANSRDEYIAIIKCIANDRNKLSKIRSELRKRMESSPLLDCAAFTRDLEKMYFDWWGEWQNTQQAANRKDV
jgi:predicted O-linked N-acetylglucosamine transferase (SPINDLY family)